jgi:hypothetical protein
MHRNQEPSRSHMRRLSPQPSLRSSVSLACAGMFLLLSTFGCGNSPNDGSSRAPVGMADRSARKLTASGDMPRVFPGLPANAPVQKEGERRIAKPESRATAKQLASRAKAAILAVWDTEQPTSVIEAVVVYEEPKLVSQGDPKGLLAIATRYSLQVSRVWGTDVGPQLEFWSLGGTLPDSVPAPSQYPRGSRDSSQFYPKDGERIIVGVVEKELVPGLVVFQVVGGTHGAVVVPQDASEEALNPADVTYLQTSPEPSASEESRKARDLLPQEIREALDLRFANKTSH